MSSDLPHPPTGSSTLPATDPPPDLYPFLGPPARPTDLGTLGPYRVLDELGRGGMGAVFRAEDPKLRRQFALKVMLPAAAGNPLARGRFVREARAQAAVEHDHIIPIYQVDDDGPTPFIAMPLLKGQTLAAALKQNPRPPLAEICRVGRQIAAGLAAAHEKGLIHRDIKPGNVWLEGDRRRVKILDFGLARAADDEPDAPAPTLVVLSGTDLTRTGAVVGTPAYMAPEQAAGKPVDHRADLWSLGVVLFQMGTGRLPFTGGTVMELLSNVIAAPTPDLSALPPGLADLVRLLLSKNPADRPASAAAVGEALRVIEQGLPTVRAVPLGPVPEPAPDVWADVATTDPDTVSVTAKPAGGTASRAGLLWALAAVLVAGGGGAAVWRMLGPKPATAPAPDRREGREAKAGPPAAPALPAAAPPSPGFVADAFREVHGVTADALQAWAKRLPAGFVPLRVTARAGSAPPVFDAVAVPDPGVSEPLLVLAPYADSQKTFDAHHHKYWALSRSLTPDGKTEVWVWGVRTAAAFVGCEHYYTSCGPTADRLDDIRKADRKVAIPFAFQTAAGTEEGDQAVLVLDRNEHGVEWDLSPEVAPEAVAAGAAAARAKGWWPRMVTVSAGTPHTFAVLYAENRPAVEWELQHELPAAEYERELRSRAAAGWVPRSVGSAETPAGPRYTVVWAKPAPATPAGGFVDQRELAATLSPYFHLGLVPPNVAGWWEPGGFHVPVGAPLPAGPLRVQRVLTDPRTPAGPGSRQAFLDVLPRLTGLVGVADFQDTLALRGPDLERLAGLPWAGQMLELVGRFEPTPELFARLARFPALKGFGCSGRGMTADLLDRLADNNPALVTLHFPEGEPARLTPGAAAAVGRLPLADLMWLALDDPAAARPLAAMAELRTLRVVVTGPRAADCVRELAAVSGLTELTVQGDLADAALTPLARLTNLKTLDLHRSVGPTAAGLRGLAAQLPGCTVLHNGNRMTPAAKK